MKAIYFIGATLGIFASAIVHDAQAAPSITGVPTNLTNGTNVSITGSGFGTKPAAAPVLFDRVDNKYSGLADGQTIPIGGSNPWPSPYGNSSGRGEVKYENTDGSRGVGAAQYKAVNSSSAYLDGLTWPKTGRTYVSWWFKTNSSVGAGTHSSKFLRMSDANDEINRTFSWTQMQNYVYDTSAGCNYGGYYGYCSNSWASTAPTPGAWTFFEAWFDANNSTYTLRMNGKTITSVSYSPGKTSFNEVWKLGFDGGGASPPAITWWMDDIYVDNTLARVFIGNAPTYAASTALEMQEPVTWTDTAISMTVHQGAIAKGAVAYLYVVDANGVVSNGGAGVKVTLGASAVAPKAPEQVIVE